MKRFFKFFGLHAEISGKLQLILAMAPFILMIILYIFFSNMRLAENPQDKLMPSVEQMFAETKRMAFEQDNRTGKYLMLQDSRASLTRMAIGVIAAAFCGLWTGMILGLFPGARAVFLNFMTFISIIPPLALLPILFIFLGIGEVSKISLIFIGVFPIITLDIYLAVQKISAEQITKAITLGANQFQIMCNIVMPQIIPRLIDTVRLSLGSAWLFLISSEAIASTMGLGFRIFLARRYQSYAIIIPYVLWIVCIGLIMNWLLKKFISWRYNWYLARL